MVRARSRLVGALLLSSLGTAWRPAHAQVEGFSGALAEQVVTRPHTIAELELGVIALPDAPISASQRGGATPFGRIGKGDATIEAGIHLLYRGGRDWAIGAGAVFGPTPTSDTTPGTRTSPSITHSRSYLFVGTEGRYIPLHYKWIEAWVGLAVGGIVIADRFDTNGNTQVPPVIGTNEVTVRTEGFSLGVQAGLSWMFAERLVVGLVLRVDRWVLPALQGAEDPRCSPIGDCPTLTGSVAAFEGGLTIGYRLPL